MTKTPEERSEVVEKAQRRAKKSYRTNTDKKRSGLTGEELEIITDSLVVLKVIGGYSNTQCAAILNVSKGQVGEIAKTDRFQKRVATTKSNLPKAALQLGQAFLVESVMAVMHVMRTETKNELVLRAAAEMFDRFGLPKLTRSENTETPADPVNDPTDVPKGLMEKLRDAPPEVQAQIADLHESFSEGVERILSGGKQNGDS